MRFVSHRYAQMKYQFKIGTQCLCLQSPDNFMLCLQEVAYVNE